MASKGLRPLGKLSLKFKARSKACSFESTPKRRLRLLELSDGSPTLSLVCLIVVLWDGGPGINRYAITGVAFEVSYSNNLIGCPCHDADLL